MLKLDCAGVSAEALAQAQRTFAEQSSLGTGTPVMMAGYYTWEYAGSEYACSEGGMMTLSWYASTPGWLAVTYTDGSSSVEYHGVGTVSVSAPVQSCEWVDRYTGTYHGDSGDDPDPPPPPTGGGGGGGGGDGDPSPPVPPPPPPPPADTCPVTVDNFQGILQNIAVQDSLRAWLQESQATDTEIPGFIWRDSHDGSIRINRGVVILADNCGYTMAAPAPPPGQSGTLLAYAHTHPNADGTLVLCRLSGLTVTTNNGANGGGSNTDWNSAATTGKPFYTIDPDGIWRLDPNSYNTANPNNWSLDGSRCAKP